MSEKIKSAAELKRIWYEAFGIAPPLSRIEPTKRYGSYDAPRTLKTVRVRVPHATAVRPPALWQWKNGRTAPLFKEDFPIEGALKAWDRSLGCYVIYADK